MNDKRIVYGLLGGAAVLVGAALISHYFQDKEGDKLGAEIDSLGTLTRDASGHIEFEQFIKIFEISSAHAKSEFSEKKKTFISQRREVIKNNDEYKKIVIQMTQEEEQIINAKLQEIMEKLNITEQEFQSNAMYHAQDHMKQMRMMQIQKNQQSATTGQVLTRQKVFETFKVQQEIQM